jgi:hypothetical protein
MMTRPIRNKRSITVINAGSTRWNILFRIASVSAAATAADVVVVEEIDILDLTIPVITKASSTDVGRLLMLLLLVGKESAASRSGPVVHTEAWTAPSMKRRMLFILYIIIIILSLGNYLIIIGTVAMYNSTNSSAQHTSDINVKCKIF